MIEESQSYRERIAKLYITNATSEWAKDQLGILIETMKDKDVEPWLVNELQRIKDGIVITHGQ